LATAQELHAATVTAATVPRLSSSPTPTMKHVSHLQHASVVGLDEVHVSAHLTRLTATAAGTPLFCIPAGMGHADGYKPLASVVKNPLYAIIHSHLQTGADLDLRVATLPELADLWAGAILAALLAQEGAVADLAASSMFYLIGASLGGLLAHQTALAACNRGYPPRLILLDPFPPTRPLRTPLETGLGTAARMIISIATGELADVDLAQVSEGEIGIVVAEHLHALGVSGNDSRTMRERAREIRVAMHLLQLTSSFCAQSDSDAANAFIGCLPSLSPAAVRQTCDTLLVLASEREKFFVEVNGMTEQEACKSSARLYGRVVKEIELVGDHISVVSKCTTGASREFNTALLQYLAEASVSGKHGE